MAIRHVVMWKLAGETNQQREEMAVELAGDLRALQDRVDSLVRITAEPNNVTIDGNWDLVLIADFSDRAGLDAYQEHPDHSAVAAKVRQYAIGRAAVDFVVD